GSLSLLRSAGERGEAEAIGREVVELIHGGADPSEIAIVLRDPARRGTLIGSGLESYGGPGAREAGGPVASTAVGGGRSALIATGRAADLLRYLRLAGGSSPGVVDGFERDLRQGRVQSASAALALWEKRFGDLPGDLARARELAADPAALAAALAQIAAVIA